MKLDHLLTEDRAQFLSDQMGDAIAQRYQKDTNKQAEPREVVNQLMKADPTQQSKYLSWIARMYIKGQFKMEDTTRIKHELAEFERVKSKLDVKDIGQYHDLPQLYKALAPFAHQEVETQAGTNNKNRERMYAEADVIHKGNDYTLLSPRTKEAAQYFGRGTKWCTSAANDNAFDAYNKIAPLYILMDADGEKYQMFFPELDNEQGVQVMDAQDQEVLLKDLFRKYHGLENLLAEKTNFSTWCDPKNAESAIWYAMNVLEGPFKEGEAAIAKDAWEAQAYANLVLQGRFVAGEAAIAKDPYAAIRYAKLVLKARWPAVESNIMKSSHAAVQYAREVIKGRWPEAEASIKQHPEDAIRYQETVLHGAEWPKEDVRHTGAKKEKQDKQD